LEKPTISTAIEIRNYLEKHGLDYPWHVWHVLHIEKKVTAMRYTSFCSYFKTLERLGLVLRTTPPKQEPQIPKYRRVHHFKSVPRAWYKLNPEKVNSPEWRHPERALYPHVFRVSGRPIGRPAGSKNRRKRTSSLPGA